MTPDASKGWCSVAIHFTLSRRASALATHAALGERAWISVTSAVRRLVASLGGRLSRDHSGPLHGGSSRWEARSRSRSGTIAPPGEATIAVPPAAATAWAVSSVARANPPPASDGTICRRVTGDKELAVVLSLWQVTQ